MSQVQFVLFLSLSMLALFPLLFAIELQRGGAPTRTSAPFLVLAVAMILAPTLWS